MSTLGTIFAQNDAGTTVAENTARTYCVGALILIILLLQSPRLSCPVKHGAAESGVTPPMVDDANVHVNEFDGVATAIAPAAYISWLFAYHVQAPCVVAQFTPEVVSAYSSCVTRIPADELAA